MAKAIVIRLENVYVWGQEELPNLETPSVSLSRGFKTEDRDLFVIKQLLAEIVLRLRMQDDRGIKK